MSEEETVSRIDEELLRQWTPETRLKRPVLAGSGLPGAYDSLGVDCPFVFGHNGRFYMMHVGFDGIGYRTGLAVSDDLLNWEHEAVILDRLEGSGRWDMIGAAGSWILLDSHDAYDVPCLRKRDGRYWMIYHAYPEEGYEAGGALMGLAWTTDESLKEWHRLEQPIFVGGEGAEWERAGLYKCCFFEHDGEFWMFYNAKGSPAWPWKEETGVARSRDLITWERYGENPIMACAEGTFYSQFYSDPCIRHDGERWLNFGFGFEGNHAQSLMAWSNDLLRWHTVPEPLLSSGGPGELDEIHAHKSSVICRDGLAYHYYCACRPWREGDPTRVEVFEGQDEFRCIALAIGKLPTAPNSRKGR